MENCIFNNNCAGSGGAVCFNGECIVKNCSFTDNSAFNGGYIQLESCDVTDCNFNGNNATYGSAIYFSEISKANNITNSVFLNNRENVKNSPFELTKNGNHTEISFLGRNNLINAISI